MILIDYTMPVMNGIEATKVIRKFFKEETEGVQESYICLLTSYNDEKLKQ